MTSRSSGVSATNPGTRLVNNPTVPGIVDEYNRTFKTARSLKVDVPLGSHPGMYNMEEKFAKLGKGGPNPFIDPEGYKLEVDIDEAMFRAVLAEQQKAGRSASSVRLQADPPWSGKAGHHPRLSG